MDQLVSSVENWRSWLPFPAFTKFGANGKFPTAKKSEVWQIPLPPSPMERPSSLPSFQFLVSQPDSCLARMNKGDKRCHAKKNTTVTVMFAFVIGFLFGVKLRELLGRS